jgi:hypothetical protein
MRHAAASVIAAWILIVPPQLGGNGHPDKRAPFSKWEQMGSYSTAAECNDDRLSFIKQDQKEYKLAIGSSSTSDAAKQDTLQSSAALCISSDDPRLEK